MKLGAVRLANQFFPEGELDQDKIEACRGFINQLIEPVMEKLISAKIDFATGNSGTIYAVKALAMANRLEFNLEHQEKKILTREELDKAVAWLLAHKTIEERKIIPGIEPDRADILPAGALILQKIFLVLNLSQLYLSDYSLREGKLLEVLEANESNC